MQEQLRSSNSCSRWEVRPATFPGLRLAEQAYQLDIGELSLERCAGVDQADREAVAGFGRWQTLARSALPNGCAMPCPRRQG